MIHHSIHHIVISAIVISTIMFGGSVKKRSEKDGEEYESDI